MFAVHLNNPKNFGIVIFYNVITCMYTQIMLSYPNWINFCSICLGTCGFSTSWAEHTNSVTVLGVSCTAFCFNIPKPSWRDHPLYISKNVPSNSHQLWDKYEHFIWTLACQNVVGFEYRYFIFPKRGSQIL